MRAMYSNFATRRDKLLGHARADARWLKLNFPFSVGAKVGPEVVCCLPCRRRRRRRINAPPPNEPRKQCYGKIMLLLSQAHSNVFRTCRWLITARAPVCGRSVFWGGANGRAVVAAAANDDDDDKDDTDPHEKIKRPTTATGRANALFGALWRTSKTSKRKSTCALRQGINIGTGAQSASDLDLPHIAQMSSVSGVRRTC